MDGCDQDRMYEVEWNQWMKIRIVPYCILMNWDTSYCPPYIDICDSEKEHEHLLLLIQDWMTFVYISVLELRGW